MVNWKTAKNKFARVDFKENLIKNRKPDSKESEDNSGILSANNIMASSRDSKIVAKKIQEDSECYQATVFTMCASQSNGNSNLESLLAHGPSTSTVAHYAPNFSNYNVTPGISATVSNGGPQYPMNNYRPLEEAAMASNNLLIPCHRKPISYRAVYHSLEPLEHLPRPTPRDATEPFNELWTLEDFRQNSNYQF